MFFSYEAWSDIGIALANILTYERLNKTQYYSLKAI